MTRGIIATVLIFAGLIVLAGLAIGAILELLQAIIAFVVWAVVILAGYFFIKSKLD